jgi:hypothetical protein
MVLDETLAEVDSSAVGTTIKSKPYVGEIGNEVFALYDTAGLNEAKQGTVDTATAITDLWTLVKSLSDGISLLVYVVNSRLSDQAKKNYEMFHDVLCQKSVKLVLVITHLENEEDRDKWWKENCFHFFEHEIKFCGQACVVANPGRSPDFPYQKDYDDSKVSLKRLILRHSSREPWSLQTESWFERVVVGFFNLGFIDKNAKVLFDALCANGMSESEAKKLTRKAVRKVRKNIISRRKLAHYFYRFIVLFFILAKYRC